MDETLKANLEMLETLLREHTKDNYNISLCLNQVDIIRDLLKGGTNEKRIL